MEAWKLLASDVLRARRGSTVSSHAGAADGGPLFLVTRHLANAPEAIDLGFSVRQGTPMRERKNLSSLLGGWLAGSLFDTRVKTHGTLEHLAPGCKGIAQSTR
jgi:hypothetical protein